MEERRAFRESRVYQEARSIGGVLVSCCHWTETPLLKHHRSITEASPKHHRSITEASLKHH
jgi:hypothetical protein